MFPYTMVEAILLEHQQMVRAVERNRLARLAGPRPPLGARVVGRTFAAAARAAAAWRCRAGGCQGTAREGQTRTAT
jgi:hypothetical protein